LLLFGISSVLFISTDKKPIIKPSVKTLNPKIYFQKKFSKNNLSNL